MVVSPVPIRPVTASLTGGAYTGNEMMEYLKQTVDNLVVVDGTAICTRSGSPKVLNVALLGAAIGSGALAFSLEQMQQTIRQRVPERYLVMNQKALSLGAQTAQQQMELE